MAAMQKRANGLQDELSKSKIEMNSYLEKIKQSEAKMVRDWLVCLWGGGWVFGL